MEPSDFGWALNQLKNGLYVCREGWNGKGQYIGLHALHGVQNHLPYIFIITVQGHEVPWVASQTDLLAEDWALVI